LKNGVPASPNSSSPSSSGPPRPLAAAAARNNTDPASLTPQQLCPDPPQRPATAEPKMFLQYALYAVLAVELLMLVLVMLPCQRAVLRLLDLLEGVRL
jgi:hypothetical protein